MNQGGEQEEIWQRAAGYKGSRALQLRSAWGIILITNTLTVPEVQTTLWAAAQKFSSSLGDGSWRENWACAGGLSPWGTRVQFTPAQKQRKNKLHLCIKFFSKAAGVLWREWMFRFTRSSKVEVEALSSLKWLQEKQQKERNQPLPKHHMVSSRVRYPQVN